MCTSAFSSFLATIRSALYAVTVFPASLHSDDWRSLYIINSPVPSFVPIAHIWSHISRTPPPPIQKRITTTTHGTPATQLVSTTTRIMMEVRLCLFFNCRHQIRTRYLLLYIYIYIHRLFPILLHALFYSLRYFSSPYISQFRFSGCPFPLPTTARAITVIPFSVCGHHRISSGLRPPNSYKVPATLDFRRIFPIPL